MATYTFDPNVPAANNAPKNDQPVMQVNNASTSGLISEDHIGFNTPNGGYHKIIHQLTGSGTQNLTRSGVGAVYANIPANIVNVNQTIAGQYTPDATVTTTDTQLFSLSAGNVISQLTGSALTSTNQSDGWTWVGTVLLQWGFVSSTSSGASNAVVFKDRRPGMIPFPNNCFFVGATLSVQNAATIGDIRTAQIVIRGSTVSTTGFSWIYSFDTSGIAQGFYWYAIGN